MDSEVEQVSDSSARSKEKVIEEPHNTERATEKKTELVDGWGENLCLLQMGYI